MGESFGMRNMVQKSSSLPKLFSYHPQTTAKYTKGELLPICLLSTRRGPHEGKVCDILPLGRDQHLFYHRQNLQLTYPVCLQTTGYHGPSGSKLNWQCCWCYKGKQLHHWSLDPPDPKWVQFNSKHLGTDFQSRQLQHALFPNKYTAHAAGWSGNRARIFEAIPASSNTKGATFQKVPLAALSLRGRWEHGAETLQCHTPNGTWTSLCACRRWEHTCMMQSLLTMNVSVHKLPNALVAISLYSDYFLPRSIH